MNETIRAILLLKSLIGDLHGCTVKCPSCGLKPCHRPGYSHSMGCKWEELNKICDELEIKVEQ